MGREVEEAAEHEGREALGALSDLEMLARRVEVATPVVFTVGLVLLGVFWLLVVGLQRRTERQADVEASIGVALYPEHASTSQELLQRADIAMYVAKDTHAGFVLFDPTQDQHSPRRLALLGELRRAIEDEQLLLHYQPKVDAHMCSTRRYTSAATGGEPATSSRSP